MCWEKRQEFLCEDCTSVLSLLAVHDDLLTHGLHDSHLHITRRQAESCAHISFQNHDFGIFTIIISTDNTLLEIYFLRV
jgi:hypothetical protein